MSISLIWWVKMYVFALRKSVKISEWKKWKCINPVCVYLAAFDLVCIKRLLFLYFWSIHCWIFSYKRPSFCCFYGIKSFWIGKPAILNIALKSFVIIISWSLNARHKFIKVSVYAGVGMWCSDISKNCHILIYFDSQWV